MRIKFTKNTTFTEEAKSVALITAKKAAARARLEHHQCLWVSFDAHRSNGRPVHFLEEASDRLRLIMRLTPGDEWHPSTYMPEGAILTLKAPSDLVMLPNIHEDYFGSRNVRSPYRHMVVIKGQEVDVLRRRARKLKKALSKVQDEIEADIAKRLELAERFDVRHRGR